MHDAHFISLVLWRGEEELAYKKVAWGLYAHLIRLVFWRGTAGEELAYKGALASDRPLHLQVILTDRQAPSCPPWAVVVTLG